MYYTFSFLHHATAQHNIVYDTAAAATARASYKNARAHVTISSLRARARAHTHARASIKSTNCLPPFTIYLFFFFLIGLFVVRAYNNYYCPCRCTRCCCRCYFALYVRHTTAVGRRGGEGGADTKRAKCLRQRPPLPRRFVNERQLFTLRAPNTDCLPIRFLVVSQGLYRPQNHRRRREKPIIIKNYYIVHCLLYSNSCVTCVADVRHRKYPLQHARTHTQNIKHADVL